MAVAGVGGVNDPAIAWRVPGREAGTGAPGPGAAAGGRPAAEAREPAWAGRETAREERREGEVPGARLDLRM